MFATNAAALNSIALLAERCQSRFQFFHDQIQSSGQWKRKMIAPGWTKKLRLSYFALFVDLLLR